METLQFPTEGSGAKQATLTETPEQSEVTEASLRQIFHIQDYVRDRHGRAVRRDALPPEPAQPIVATAPAVQDLVEPLRLYVEPPFDPLDEDLEPIVPVPVPIAERATLYVPPADEAPPEPSDDYGQFMWGDGYGLE